MEEVVRNNVSAADAIIVIIEGGVQFGDDNLSGGGGDILTVMEHEQYDRTEFNEQRGGTQKVQCEHDGVSTRGDTGDLKTSKFLIIQVILKVRVWKEKIHF